jgi:hypothetical protein
LLVLLFVDPVKRLYGPSYGVVDPQIVISGSGIIHVEDDAMGADDHDPLVKLIQHRQQGNLSWMDVRKEPFDFGSLHETVFTIRRDNDKGEGKGNSCAYIYSEDVGCGPPVVTKRNGPEL